MQVSKQKEHAKIFKKLLKERKIAQTALVELSGMHQSKINRFVNGVIDLSAGEFFQLLDLMPIDFQEAFWKRKLGIGTADKISTDEKENLKESIEEAVEKLSPLEQIRIIKTIAEKGNLFKQQNQELASIG